MHKGTVGYVPECAVSLIDVEIIIFMKIVADVQIRIPVEVNVAGYYAKTVSNSRCC